MVMSRSEAEDRDRILRLQCLAAAALTVTTNAEADANNLDVQLDRAEKIYKFVTTNDQAPEKEDAPF